MSPATFKFLAGGLVLGWFLLTWSAIVVLVWYAVAETRRRWRQRILPRLPPIVKGNER